VGLVKEKKYFLRASQEKMWKCLKYKGWVGRGTRIIMNVTLRMFAYKIERRGTSELSQIEDLEDNWMLLKTKLNNDKLNMPNQNFLNNK